VAAPELNTALVRHAAQPSDESFRGVLKALIGAELLVPYAPEADGRPPATRPDHFRAARAHDAHGRSALPAFADEAALLRWSGGRPWPSFPVTSQALCDVATAGGQSVHLHSGSPEALWLDPELVHQLGDLLLEAAPPVLDLEQAAASAEPAPWASTELADWVRARVTDRPEVEAAALFDAVLPNGRWRVCGLVLSDEVPAARGNDIVLALQHDGVEAFGRKIWPWFVRLQPVLLARVQQVVQPVYLRASDPAQPPTPSPSTSQGEQLQRLQELQDMGLLSPGEAALRRAEMLRRGDGV
jgi:hypothetical protein